MSRPGQIEKQMTIAGAAVGAAIGLPYGPTGLVIGLVAGALIPIPGLFLFAVVSAGFLKLFFKEPGGERPPEEDAKSEL